MEEWRDIKGYDGMYQVSNCGRVRSVNRVLSQSNHTRRFFTGKLLKPYIDKYGYKKCTLSKNGRTKHFFVHRLVAIAFIDNPQNYPFVNHKDEDTSNENASNLEWCTAKYNVNYGTSIQRRTRNTDFPKRSQKLNKKIAQYDLNGNLIKVWNSRNDAIKSGFTGTAITRCAQGKRKTHKGFVWKYYGVRVGANTQN